MSCNVYSYLFIIRHFIFNIIYNEESKVMSTICKWLLLNIFVQIKFLMHLICLNKGHIEEKREFTPPPLKVVTGVGWGVLMHIARGDADYIITKIKAFFLAWKQTNRNINNNIYIVFMCSLNNTSFRYFLQNTMSNKKYYQNQCPEQ